jgi:hypothetical protein
VRPARWARRTALLGLAACAACAADGNFEPVAPPWVEFVRRTDIRGALDSSRIVVTDPTEVRVPIRFDYVSAQPLPSDSTQRFSRMESVMLLRCPLRQMRDDGMRLFDRAGQQVAHWEPAVESFVEFSEHPIGEEIPRLACLRLEELRTMGRSGTPPDSGR